MSRSLTWAGRYCHTNNYLVAARNKTVASAPVASDGRRLQLNAGRVA
ncbi:MAG: hypothetical protein ACR2I4_09090 [Actinomycetota bacterium]|nr:hypothetical protein [Actinomycetota bacterium]